MLAHWKIAFSAPPAAVYPEAMWGYLLGRGALALASLPAVFAAEVYFNDFNGPVCSQNVIRTVPDVIYTVLTPPLNAAYRATVEGSGTARPVLAQFPRTRVQLERAETKDARPSVGGITHRQTAQV